jgi:L,D-peptidoglycan transpeptidase YkuD (ErfK/YbiS/YcfS/YnhG family)
MKGLATSAATTAFFALVLAGCSLGGKVRSGEAPELSAAERQAIVKSLGKKEALPEEAAQLLLVTAQPSSVPAAVSAWEKRDGKWAEILPPVPAVVGRAGFASPGEKREGDGRTPSGTYPLRRAFGYAPQSPTRLLYRQATEEDIWVDDVNSPDYNRWVNRRETTATSFEEMRRKDDLYKYGIVIEYNTLPVVKGNGSAIFFHIWKGSGQPTSGCVAMDEQDLLKVLEWLDPAKNPVTAMGTEAALREM